MIDIINWRELPEQHPDFVDLVGQEIDEMDWYALLLAGASRRGMTSLLHAEIKSDEFARHPFVLLITDKFIALIEPAQW